MYNFFIWFYFHLLLVYFFIANFLSLFLVYHKGSFSCLLFFLIYIDILSNVRASTIKQFAYHFFFLVHDAKPLAFELNQIYRTKLDWNIGWKYRLTQILKNRLKKLYFLETWRCFVKNVQMNARNICHWKTICKLYTIFSHYSINHLKTSFWLQSCSLCKKWIRLRILQI